MPASINLPNVLANPTVHKSPLKKCKFDMKSPLKKCNFAT